MHRVHVLGAAALVSCLLLAGCQVRSPGNLETRLIQGAKRRITVGGRSDPNPLVSTTENIHAGQRNFTSYCMVCHGLDGQNTGVPFAEKMAPPVPLLNSPSVQAYTDGQLHRIIENGVSPSGMPASKGVFSDEEIWQLVLYIRHLPAKGSLGEPQVYGGTGCQDPNCAH
ncbi:MAG TPA: cytochrome c [Candidatus Sulfotelmatobacter sp.]|nr:cytochrome c [Candidatus Sulfotelmatobacter sp.]